MKNIICQNCGRPIITDDGFRINKDGSINK